MLKNIVTLRLAQKVTTKRIKELLSKWDIATLTTKKEKNNINVDKPLGV